MPQHSISDCIHNETFKHIADTLKRLDRHTERSAIAMEEMAKHSGILSNHEVRILKNENDIAEAFKQIRSIDYSAASDEDLKGLMERISNVELMDARKRGADGVIKSRARFWSGVKQQISPYVLIWIFFVLHLCDKFNIFQTIAKWFKEM